MSIHGHRGTTPETPTSEKSKNVILINCLFYTSKSPFAPGFQGQLPPQRFSWALTLRRAEHKTNQPSIAGTSVNLADQWL